MANHLFKLLPALLLAASVAPDAHAQEADFEALSKIPRDTTHAFPPDYKIARPRLFVQAWDDDYDAYQSFITPAMKKTQSYLNFQDKGVTTTLSPNSIIPHAQLDTSTMVNDPGKLAGTWRMLKFRSIRFNDSVYLPTETYYRLPDVILDDKSQDDAFAVITDNSIKMYVKEAGKTSFKKMMSGKYKVENNRSLMMYKVFKSGGGVSQYGIDEKGHLIINYPSVIENVKKGEYFSYYAVIQQYIYERVK